jgi:RNA polymerase sigma factor (TIGR02999 family)
MKERETRWLGGPLGDTKTDTTATLEDEQQLDLDHLFSVAYEELHRIARSVKYSGPEATITPSTLVNEAWLRLSKSPKLAVCSELHFKHIAAQAMRRVLVEAARRRWARKRGGNGSAIFVPFDDSTHTPVTCDRDLLALDAALEELKSVNPRQSTLVQIRFFGGLGVTQAAELLHVSESTVLREWRTAKAWLASQILRKR